MAEVKWVDEDGGAPYDALALRWDGSRYRPKGFPVSRNYPTWFIVPGELEGVIRNKVDELLTKESGESHDKTSNHS